MQVSLLGAFNFTDNQAYEAVTNHLGATHTPLIPLNVVFRMLEHYRKYKADGMGDSWILGEMKRQRVQITGGIYTPSDAQILGFVTALKRLSAGDMPPNPNERPSWTESFKEGPLGTVFEKTPWLGIVAGIGGVILLYGAVTGAARGFTGR